MQSHGIVRLQNRTICEKSCECKTSLQLNLRFVWSHAYTTALRLVVISRMTGQCCYDRSCAHIKLIFEFTSRAFLKTASERLFGI